MWVATLQREGWIRSVAIEAPSWFAARAIAAVRFGCCPFDLDVVAQKDVRLGAKGV